MEKIKIIYYGKTSVKQNSKDHKFRIEGFIIQEEQKKKLLKIYFKIILKKRLKYKEIILNYMINSKRKIMQMIK